MREALLERSGGNPFFLEELVALLGEREAAEGSPAWRTAPELQALPDTLRGLVAARLDGLSPDERAVLRTPPSSAGAAPSSTSAGSTSTSPGIDVDAALAELVAKEILVLDGGQLVVPVGPGPRGRLQHAHQGRPGQARTPASPMWHRERTTRASWPDHRRQLAHHYGVAAELAHELGGARGVPDDLCERALTWFEAAERARRG